MALNPDQRKLRARIAANTRHHGPDHPETAEAHRAYRAAALEEHVHRALAEEPAISAAQRHRLAVLLTPNGEVSSVPA